MNLSTLVDIWVIIVFVIACMVVVAATDAIITGVSLQEDRNHQHSLMTNDCELYNNDTHPKYCSNCGYPIQKSKLFSPCNSGGCKR